MKCISAAKGCIYAGGQIKDVSLDSKATFH